VSFGEQSETEIFLKYHCISLQWLPVAIPVLPLGLGTQQLTELLISSWKDIPLSEVEGLDSKRPHKRLFCATWIRTALETLHSQTSFPKSRCGGCHHLFTPLFRLKPSFSIQPQRRQSCAQLLIKPCSLLKSSYCPFHSNRILLSSLTRPRRSNKSK
jgi:hypothetical protein